MEISDYMQFMPPSLQDNTAPAELLLAAMDLAGVDRAVLQFGYGNVNKYFAEAITRYPGHFYGMGRPREDTADPGARAEHVAFLVPVWWILRGQDYRAVWAQFTRWCDRHPGIPSVIVQGIPVTVMLERGTIRLPDYVVETVRRHAVFVEICYAITHAIWEEYPLPQTNRLVLELYTRLEPDPLVWGSDFPNIERLCTCAQSLNHVRQHCPFIGAPEARRRWR